MRVFDPRDGQWKESDNPALMSAQFVREQTPPPEIDEGFVAKMADYCEGTFDDVKVETTDNGDGTFTHRVTLKG